MNLEQSGSSFPPTLWSVVRRAGGDTKDAKAAMNRLMELYWSAVYSFLQRSGKRREAAAELTQAFFVDVVLERKLIQGADESKGRLRSLLLTALKRYLIDAHRREAARSPKSASGTGLKLDAAHLDHEEKLVSAFNESPEDMFDRRWALAILQETIRRCEKHWTAIGKRGHWGIFEARVVRPSVSLVKQQPLETLFAEFGFPSAADAAAAIQTVKKRFETLMKEVIAETMDEGADMEAEYGFVLSKLKLR